MCGFAGILKFKGPPLTSEDKAILKKMGHRLRYRGPDDEKIFMSEDSAMIFRRLSIIDLEGGEQPFSDSAGRLKLMVNGEIYNYKSIREKCSAYPFKSHSDCEVILPLYLEKGLGFTEDLVGMFALALWDSRKKELILCRDHLGIKPLFYTVTDKGHLLYASELKALWVHPDCPKEMDWDFQISRGFFFNPSSPERSGFKRIHYLEPGSMAIFNDGKISLKKWWKFPEVTKQDEANDHRTENEVIEGYRELLKDAVASQLMSDVGVGIALSGGIDSVSITAYASKIQPIETFTVLSLSLFKNGDAVFAHKASKFLGMPNHQLYFPWQDNVLDYTYLKQVLFAQERELDPEHLYKYLMYRSIKKSYPHIKTVLIGQGSDEFNGGYCHQYTTPENDTWEGFENRYLEKHKLKISLFEKPELFFKSPFLNQNFLAEKQKKFDYGFTAYQNNHLDSLSDFNLWHEDRNSAANKLENRVPFLDHRLVEYTARVPRKYHKTLFWEKQILRRSLDKDLPEEIKNRPKVPFFVGEGERYTNRMIYNIISANNHEFFREAILDNPYVKDIYDISSIEKKYKAIPDCPSYDHLRDILSLASTALLAKWVKEGTEIAQDDHVQLEWLDIPDWETSQEDLAVRMGEGESKISPDDTVALNKDYAVYINPEGTRAVITKEFSLEYDIDLKTGKNFYRFLAELNEPRPIIEILNKLDLSFGDLCAQIEEGLEYHYLIKLR